MNLQNYLIETRETQASFAARLGVSQGTVSNWVTGSVPVPVEQWEPIYKATAGLVTAFDLRPTELEHLLERVA